MPSNPVHRQVTSVIAGHWRFLLVGTVVLFIEDHKPEGRQWHEDCRTGPHHDEGLIRIQTTAPATHLLSVATSAVIFHDPGTEPTAAAVDQLRDEADLWGKEQHVPALG